MYDGLLRTIMSKKVDLIEFINDLAFISIGFMTCQLEEFVNECIRLVQKWISGIKLQLVTHKTEVVMLTNKSYTRQVVDLGGQRVEIKWSLKYL